jgi:hypothetical protein
MADTGVIYPGTASTSNAVGTRDWTNPDNIKANDGAIAACQGVSTGTSYSYYLKGTNFGFAIPAGATIDGILFELERARQNVALTGIYDSEVKIIKADGSIGGTNKAVTGTNWGTGYSIISYGSSTDKWGESWTEGDIEDADFGVALSVRIVGDGDMVSGKANVDFFRITVYYTEGSSSSIKSVTGVAQASIKSVTGVAEASINKVNGVAN